MTYSRDSIFSETITLQESKDNIRLYPQFGIAADCHRLSDGNLIIERAVRFRATDSTNYVGSSITMVDKKTFTPTLVISHNSQKEFVLVAGHSKFKNRGGDGNYSYGTITSKNPSYIVNQLKKPQSPFGILLDKVRQEAVTGTRNRLVGVFETLLAHLGDKEYSSVYKTGKAGMYLMKLAFGEMTIDELPLSLVNDLKEIKEKHIAEAEAIKKREDQIDEWEEKGMWAIRHYQGRYVVNEVKFDRYTSSRDDERVANLSSPTYSVRELKDLPDEIKTDLFVSLAMCKTRRTAVAPDCATSDADGYIPKQDIVLADYGAICRTTHSDNSPNIAWDPDLFLVAR